MSEENKEIEPMETEAVETESQNGGYDMPWLIAAGAITFVSILLRFIYLGLKPFHHDEGVNGWFLIRLYRDGFYQYDAHNYHGPTLYYITLAFTKVFGLEDLPVRWSVAVWGVLMVVVMFFLKRYIGKTGSLFAGLFLALSPGMVYISRYFIHEIFFVFLSLTFVVAIIYFIEKRKAGIFALGWLGFLLMVCFSPFVFSLTNRFAGESPAAYWSFIAAFGTIAFVLTSLIVKMVNEWEDGRPVYLLLASASLSLYFATKETAFITLGTMLISCLCVWVWRKLLETDLWKENKLNLIFGIIGLKMAVVVAAVFYYRDFFAYDDISKTWLGYTFLNENSNQGRYLLMAILLLATLAAIRFILYLKDMPKEDELSFAEPADLTFGSFIKGLGRGADRILIITAVVVLFVYLWVLFFSSFFTFSGGLKRSLEAYAIWTKTGSKDHTQNGFLGFVKWDLKIESPLLILSLIGTFIAFFKGRHKFIMFAGLWAWGLFLAYSIIPYKTPWLDLSFILPMCAVGGYAIGELLRSTDQIKRGLTVAAAAVAVGILAYQTYDLNFVRYDDEEMVYVYAHTKRGYQEMISRIDEIAEASSLKKDISVVVASNEYWPMSWTMRHYQHTGFHGTAIDSNSAEVIVTKKGAQDEEAIRKYSAHYKFEGVYPLRPGVDLALLVRNDLAKPDAQDLFMLRTAKVK